MNEVKRYVNTVERHLRLDRTTRLRVMNDLASDLQAVWTRGRLWKKFRRAWEMPEPWPIP